MCAPFNRGVDIQKLRVDPARSSHSSFPHSKKPGRASRLPRPTRDTVAPSVDGAAHRHPVHHSGRASTQTTELVPKSRPRARRIGPRPHSHCTYSHRTAPDSHPAHTPDIPHTHSPLNIHAFHTSSVHLNSISAFSRDARCMHMHFTAPDNPPHRMINNTHNAPLISPAQLYLVACATAHAALHSPFSCSGNHRSCRIGPHRPTSRRAQQKHVSASQPPRRVVPPSSFAPTTTTTRKLIKLLPAHHAANPPPLGPGPTIIALASTLSVFRHRLLASNALDAPGVAKSLRERDKPTPTSSFAPKQRAR